MITRKLIFVSVVAVILTITGAVVCAASNIVLDSHTMLTAHGSGSCDGYQSCGWCDSSPTGSEYCGGTIYFECFSNSDPNDSCGNCTLWTSCVEFYSCSSPGCVICEITGGCEGCTTVTGSDRCP